MMPYNLAYKTEFKTPTARYISTSFRFSWYEVRDNGDVFVSRHGYIDEVIRIWF